MWTEDNSGSLALNTNSGTYCKNKIDVILGQGVEGGEGQ